MSDYMTQEDAMNMNYEQAIQILKSMQRGMLDIIGCPISDAYFALGKAVEALSSRPMDDLISRQMAIDALAKHEKSKGHNYTLFVDIVSECAEIIRNLPFAQPEQKWIPVKFRPMDEEEKQYWEEYYGYKFDEEDSVTFDCPMPEDGEEVWVCSKCGNIWQDTCEVDEGIGLEGNGDWDDIVAWMPFERPKPYKGEKE